MKDSLQLNDVFEFETSKYVTVDKIRKNDISYYFVNKLIDEETPSKEFYVYKDDPKLGFIQETDEKILKELLVTFSDNMNKLIATITESEEGAE